MVGQFNLKSLQSLHPSTTSMKMKTLLHSHMFQQICQVARAISKMKSMLMQLVSKKDASEVKRWKTKKRRKKSLFSSITMHYNWCSNSVIPMPEMQETRHDYYDSTWNTSMPGEEEYVQNDCLDDPNLSGYLKWLEEKAPDEEMEEIDRLADKFIASCHEKFRLEKQESYRRYQEMLARSM